MCKAKQKSVIGWTKMYGSSDKWANCLLQRSTHDIGISGHVLSSVQNIWTNDWWWVEWLKEESNCLLVDSFQHGALALLVSRTFGVDIKSIIGWILTETILWYAVELYFLVWVSAFINLEISDFVIRQRQNHFLGKHCQLRQRDWHVWPLVNNCPQNVLSQRAIDSFTVDCTASIIFIFTFRLPFRALCSPNKKWPCAGQAALTRTSRELENEFLKQGPDSRVLHVIFSETNIHDIYIKPVQLNKANIEIISNSKN